MARHSKCVHAWNFVSGNPEPVSSKKSYHFGSDGPTPGVSTARPAVVKVKERQKIAFKNVR
jgi:hypothetical protein